MVRRSTFGSVNPKPSKAKPRYLEAQYLVPIGAWKKWPKQLTAPSGEPKKKIYKTFKLTQEADAWNWIHAAEKAIDMGTWEPPALKEAKADADTTTFGEYAEYYVENHRNPRGGGMPAPTTKDKYRQYLRDHLLPVFADRPMVLITDTEITEWYDSMHVGKAGEGLSVKKHVGSFIKSLFNDACTKPWKDTGRPLLGANPAANITLPRENRRNGNGSATMAEMDIMAAHMKPRNMLAIYLMGIQGLRNEEVEGLRRDDIVFNTPDADNMPHDIICVKQGAKRVSDGEGGTKMIVGATKTPESVRTVDIKPSLIPIIRAHLDRFVEDAPDALLFTGERSHGILPDTTLRNQFDHRALPSIPRLAALGKDGHTKKFRVYDLRHSAATIYEHAGASRVETDRFLGHTVDGMTGRYEHSLSVERKRLALRIDAAWKAERKAAGIPVDYNPLDPAYAHVSLDPQAAAPHLDMPEWDTSQAAAPDTPHDTPTRESTTGTSGTTTGGDNVAVLAHALAGMPVADRAAMLDGVDAGTVTRVLAAMPPAQRLETIMVLHGGKENRE